MAGVCQPSFPIPFERGRGSMPITAWMPRFILPRSPSTSPIIFPSSKTFLPRGYRTYPLIISPFQLSIILILDLSFRDKKFPRFFLSFPHIWHIFVSSCASSIQRLFLTQTFESFPRKKIDILENLVFPGRNK